MATYFVPVSILFLEIHDQMQSEFFKQLANFTSGYWFAFV